MGYVSQHSLQHAWPKPQFLKQYNKPVAQEICAVYVDTMQKCMYSLLKHYIKKLSALKVHILNLFFMGGQNSISRVEPASLCFMRIRLEYRIASTTALYQNMFHCLFFFVC
jgi:hypothetical protein